MMNLKLKDLNLSPKDLRHITKYLAKKKNIADYDDESLMMIKASLMMNYYILLKIKMINNNKE